MDFTGTPENQRDRERFATLTREKRAQVRRVANRAYDGTRTVDLCWTIALDVVEAMTV